MEHFILWQFDAEITLRGGQRIAEAEVGNSVDKTTKFNDYHSGRYLFVQGAGGNSGRDPCGNCGGIEAKFFNAVTVQHGSESQFGHA